MSDAHGPASGATIKLSVMMFLQFFAHVVWGAWYVSMTGFMNRMEMGGLIAMAYSVGPIAAILSPLFLGLIADRFFATEKVLGVMHVVGGGLLCLAPLVASKFDAETGVALAHPFILVLLGHMLCYMPTLGLTTTISFHNLTNREKQFPLVRVWGTIGWIVGNISVSMLPQKDAAAEQFYLAGGAAVALGLFSFVMLPHTPPPAKGAKPRVGELLGLDSISMLKRPSYAVFILCSFLMCIPLAGYYAFARNYVEAADAVVNKSAVFTMSFGQMSEVFFMLVMPLFFARLGVKWMLAIGMGAWVMRYGLFAGAWDGKTMWMILMGIILHGVCYDFFFVTGMVYADRSANPKIRGQAQGFLVLVTQGLGMLIGAQLFGKLVAKYTDKASGVPDVLHWEKIWLIPCVFAGVILLIFLALFRDRAGAEETPATS